MSVCVCMCVPWASHCWLTYIFYRSLLWHQIRAVSCSFQSTVCQDCSLKNARWSEALLSNSARVIMRLGSSMKVPLLLGVSCSVPAFGLPLDLSSPAGHSLGGALATLAAYDIQKRLQEAGQAKVHVVCYSFGAPRTGNHAFAKDYNQMVPDTWSIINDQVIVACCASRFASSNCFTILYYVMLYYMLLCWCTAVLVHIRFYIILYYVILYYIVLPAAVLVHCIINFKTNNRGSLVHCAV